MAAKNRYDFRRSPFFRLRSIHVLAKLLGVRPHQLEKKSKLFTSFHYGEVPKSDGTTRRTETPVGTLRWIHERVLDLFQRIETPDYLHSGVKRRSYITNAKSHIGDFETYTVDLKKFFPSISWTTIYRLFRDRFDCNGDVAAIMANLLTADQRLATGSPASTLVSYFAHKTLFDRLAHIAEINNASVTLYVDDLTFSAPRITGSFRWAIQHEFRKAQVKFHKEKVYRKPNGREITGVIVHRDSIAVPQRRHKAIYDTNIALRSSLDRIEQERMYRALLSRISEAAQIQPELIDRKSALKAAKPNILGSE